MLSANWNPKQSKWELLVKNDNSQIAIATNFLLMGNGYYKFDEPFIPDYKCKDDFNGEIIHPQNWNTQELYNKKIAIIGSGATAVTLIPELAKHNHVTLIQRSPAYIVAAPNTTKVFEFIKQTMPEMIAHRIIRFIKICRGQFIYHACIKNPQLWRKRFLSKLKPFVNSQAVINKHFTPKYNPWEQRVAADPDGKLFTALKAGNVTVYTDTIKSFVKDGIELDHDGTVQVDTIISATGFNMDVFDGIQLSIDGVAINEGDSYLYKGCLLTKIPNLVKFLGYVNSSWTLKAELVSFYTARILNYMHENKLKSFCVNTNELKLNDMPILGFSSSYIKRVTNNLPKCSDIDPFQSSNNYFKDRNLNDEYIKFDS